MGKLFSAVRGIAKPFLPVRRAVYAEPVGEDPCIFIANHIGAMGPIYMAATFPLGENAAIWCNEGVMDEKLIVEYARHDWWWRPESRLAPFYSATVPYLAKAIVPRLMRSAPTIPVYRDSRIMTTMRQTVRALKEGRHIIIFPELPDGYDSHAEKLQMGWLNIVSLYRRQTGKELKMVPVYIDQKAKVFRVGKGITADADIPLAEQEDRIERYLAAGIRNEPPQAE